MSASQVIDLNTWPSAQHAVRCDVCIIGAGAAGIYVAVGLASRGFDVVLLEAGGTVAAPGSTLIGSDVTFARDPYPGATAGRYFGIGGTTSQWGGYLIPHGVHDVRPATWAFDPWSHVVRRVFAHREAVLTTLGWPDADGFSVGSTARATSGGKALKAAGLEVVSGLMMPPTRRNFAGLLNKSTSLRAPVRLYSNAIVTSLQSSNGALDTITSVRATSTAQRGLEVTASRFVIAAGALESARLLLEMNRAADRAMIRSTAAVGCYLTDHLSVPIGAVTSETRKRAVEHFAPRFEHGWMRSFRFLEADCPVGSPRGFAHFTFDTDSAGFRATKEVLRALQARRRPRIQASNLASGCLDVAGLGFHRFVRRRLYVRPGTDVQLQLDVEQQPARQNRISLGESTDRFGRPVAEVHWRITAKDIERISETAQRFLSKWRGAGGLPELHPFACVAGALKPHDAYHPVGTCRLGEDPEAVVDPHLKVWGLNNLWVLSTAVLPSAGTANPTFTMLCLGEQLLHDFARSSHFTAGRVQRAANA